MPKIRYLNKKFKSNLLKTPIKLMFVCVFNWFFASLFFGFFCLVSNTITTIFFFYDEAKIFRRTLKNVIFSTRTKKNYLLWWDDNNKGRCLNMKTSSWHVKTNQYTSLFKELLNNLWFRSSNWEGKIRRCPGNAVPSKYISLHCMSGTDEIRA